jgi:excisionase family DNA binding protein
MSRATHIGLQEAADQLGVHYMTVYRYVRTGRLAAVRVDGEWRVAPGDVRQLQAQPVVRKTTRSRSHAAASVWLEERLCAADEAGAWRVVEETLIAGAEPVDILVDVLAPAMERIGGRWVAGELSIADEHRATAVALRLIGRLGPRFARRGTKRGTVVIGAPAGEQHSLPVALAADVLRGAGFEVVDLGVNTPAASFAEVAGSSGVRAVVITATAPDHQRAVAAVTRAIRSSGVQVPVVVGGAAFPDEASARRVGADKWSAGDARALVGLVEGLLSSR